MTDTDRTRWETRYRSGTLPVHTSGNRWLVAQATFLDTVISASASPPHALDIACGTGGTLVWLAQRGWRVTGVDISTTALTQARAHLDAVGLLDRATLIEADLDTWRPDAECYDLITCFHFLDRRLWPALRTAVRPRGLICLSTYHTGRLVDHPETNPGYLLAPDELASLIKGWRWRLLAAQRDTQMEAVLGEKFQQSCSDY